MTEQGGDSNGGVQAGSGGAAGGAQGGATDGGSEVDRLKAAQEMASRRKRQLEEATATIGSLTERLSALEKAERDRAEENKAKERERLEKAGEFDQIKSALQADLEKLQAERDQIKTRWDEHLDTVKAETTKLLESVEDLEQRKQLEDKTAFYCGEDTLKAHRFVREFIEQQNSGAPVGATGVPASRSSSGTPNLDAVKADPAFMQYAKQTGVADNPEQLEKFAAQYAAVKAQRRGGSA